MRSYERQPDFGDLDMPPVQVPVEWEYVRTRRRPGAPDGSLPVRVLLIEQGASMVDQRGPGALSVSECARRVGVSKGAPYVWFENAADFRFAVAASLTADLVAELGSRSRAVAEGNGGDGGDGGDGNQDPILRLRGDVELIVQNWIGNGMGVDLIFGEGGPASRIDLRWEAERLLSHLSAPVHEATACGCSAALNRCFAQQGLVDSVLAICHGYAALARTTGERPENVARSAGRAAGQLMAGAT